MVSSHRGIGAFIVSAVLVLPGVSAAQGGEGGAGGAPPEPPPGEPAAPADSPPPPADDAARAEKLFLEGRDAYVAKDYAVALDRFRASHAIVPSPNSRLFIARCLRELGQFAAAHEQLALVVRETEGSEKYARTHEAAIADRDALDARIARVAISLSREVPGARVTINAREIEAALIDEPVIIAPGKVVVEASAPDRRPFRWVGKVEAGETGEVVVELEPLAAPPPPPPDDEGTDLRVFAIGAAGLGVAGFATWGILGIMAANRHSDLEAECGGRCPSSYQDDIDAGRRETLFSTVGLVVGAVGVAGGVTLWFLSEHEGAPWPTAGVRWDGTGAALVGSF